MSFKEIKSLFVDPEGKGLKLWRYMDFTKFLSLLNNQSLFFSSGKTLREIDPWEGIWCSKSLINIEKGLKQHSNEYNSSGFDIKETLTRGAESVLEITFISCWNYNHTESDAMWKLYVKSDWGVCIKTNFQNFKQSFDNSGIEVFSSKIWYIDYDREDFWDNPNLLPTVNAFIPFLHKRNILKHENEYRAFVMIQKDEYAKYNMTDKGVFVPVSCEDLIEEVVVAPGSPKWFFELVCDAISKYNLNKPVRYSIEDKKPYQDD